MQQVDVMPLAESVDRLVRGCSEAVISLKEITGQVFASVSVDGQPPAVKVGTVGESGSSVLVRAMADLVSRDPAPVPPAIDLAADVRRQDLRRERTNLESLLTNLRAQESATKARLMTAVEDHDDAYLLSIAEDLLGVRDEISDVEVVLDAVVLELAALN